MLRRNDDSIPLDSGHPKATEEDGDQRTLGQEILRKKCGQRDLNCVVQVVL